MRDKLAELLEEAEGQINNDLPTVEQIADYLIEHGVIVPPCKDNVKNTEDAIYPLTITADRYTGTYSGGAFIAWNLDADEIPKDIYYSDCECWDFWDNNKIICGKGNTVAEAIADLYAKLKGADNEQRETD